MNISSFFIDRPRFAGVLSIFIFLIGVLAIFRLPISEYPEVAPPQVVVRAQFPGANPRVISEAVAIPLEEQVNGIENMLYYASQATADGGLTLTVTFKIGTSPEAAETAVQNRINRALPRLPEIVRQIGVTTEKSSPNLTMVVHLVSPDNSRDALYLRNYAQINVRDDLLRLQGAGSVFVFGSGDYAMRVWLDPVKLATRKLTTDEVVNAIREQNVQVAAGTVGAPPSQPPESVTPPSAVGVRPVPASMPLLLSVMLTQLGSQGLLTQGAGGLWPRICTGPSRVSAVSLLKVVVCLMHAPQWAPSQVRLPTPQVMTPPSFEMTSPQLISWPGESHGQPSAAT
jgi:multidrug efflux pump subunit AcrB